jgi:hypothetical protein
MLEMMSKIFILSRRVEKFLSEEKDCKKELKEEVISTLNSIDAKEGRKWVFTSVDNKYFIDEYNEYDDFVKTYIFRNEQ